MISGRRACCRPPGRGTARPARPAARHGLDPAWHRDTDVHLGVRLGEGPKEGTSAGVTMVAAPVSAFTGRPVRGLAMSAKSPSTAKRSRSAASARKCSPRTAGAWAAPPAAGEPQAGGARRRPPARGRCLLRHAGRGVGSIWPCIVRKSSSRIPSRRAHDGSIPGTLPASYRPRRRTARCTRRARPAFPEEKGASTTRPREVARVQSRRDSPRWTDPEHRAPGPNRPQRTHPPRRRGPRRIRMQGDQTEGRFGPGGARYGWVATNRRRVPGLLALPSSGDGLGCPPSPERDSVWR